MVTYIDATQSPSRRAGVIKIHGEEGFAGMRKAGHLCAQALDMVAELVHPGVSTQEIEDKVLAFARDHNAIPATIFYAGYRHASCISVNHVVCHGIPDEKKLREGDIVNVDVTLIVDGWHGDSSRMYTAGTISRKAERLLEVTYECLMRGIAVAKPGNTTGDIGHAIQSYAEGERTSVVRDFVGHGLGQLFHDEPNIMHFGTPGGGVELHKGMIFTIEPMINLGRPQVKIKEFRQTPNGKVPDNWTAVTRDRSLSAQFEHSIGITDEGCEIFTLSPKGLHHPPYAVSGA